MNLNSFRYFIEVARTLSFTQASKNLHVSQPGISQQVTLLEEQLGVQLLHRTTKKVELTKEGMFLFERLGPSMDLVEETVHHVVAANTLPTIVEIATIPTAASLLLPNIIHQLTIEHPAVSFNLMETTSKNIEELVLSGACHIGFIRASETTLKQKEDIFDSLLLPPSPIKVVVNIKHRLANRTSVSLSELKEEPFLHYDAIHSPELYQALDTAFTKHNFTPNTISSGAELLTIANMIKNNIGITCMTMDMFELIENKQIRSIDIEDMDISSSIGVIWRKEKLLNVHTKIMYTALQESHNHTLV